MDHIGSESRPGINLKINSVERIKISGLHLSDLPNVATILKDFVEFRGLDISNIERMLYLRFRYGKWINRIDRCIKHGSPKFLFTDTYDLTAFVAEEAKNRVVGVIIAYPTMDDVWLLHQIAVLPNYRRRGIGYQLMKKLVAHIKSREGQKIQLYVQPNNLAAVKLYKKLGFTIANQPILMEMDLRNLR